MVVTRHLDDASCKLDRGQPAGDVILQEVQALDEAGFGPAAIQTFAKGWRCTDSVNDLVAFQQQVFS